MGLFGKNREEINFEDIASAVIIEQTQLYRNGSSWGVSLGAHSGDDRIIAMNGNVPAGLEVKFSVTYKNGTKEIIKAKSGTELCDRLLQIAIDPAPAQSAEQGDDKAYTPVTLGKNQLPAGQYIIGKDIPAGTYDFTWVWGSGSITKFKSSDTTLKENNYFQWVGNTHSYEARQCINVKCADGEMLEIGGNIIVGISKSKPVELDL